MRGRSAKVSLIALFAIIFFCSLSFGYTVKINNNTRNFKYKRPVTIQDSQVQGGPHNNFPMLFDSDVSNLKDDLKQSAGKVERSDGYDIVFATGDGVEILKHEKEKWDYSSGVYLAWVKVDLTGSDQTIYLYYGSTDVTDSDANYIKNTNKPLVWDDGGSNYFKGVWHLSETSGGGIAVDGTASSGIGNDSITISHTTGSGSNRLMLVGIYADYDDDDPDDISVTYNDVDLELVGFKKLNWLRIWIYKLVAPPTGPYDLVVTLPVQTFNRAAAGVMTFTGVDQDTPLGTFQGATGSASPATVDVSSAEGELVFDTVGDRNYQATVGADQTQRWNIEATQRFCAGSTEPGAPTVTMSWTFTNTSWAIGAVPIKPVRPIKDSTQYGNHGIAENNPTLGAGGKIDNAVSFDGTNDRRIKCGTDGSLDISSGTLEAWIYPEGWGPGGWGTIMDRGASNNDWGYQFAVTDYGNGYKDVKIYGDGSYVGSGSSTVSLGSWQHVAVVLTGSVAKFYVNGNPKDQPSWSIAAKGTATFYIGWCKEVAGEEFEGIIDEVRVSNYERSQDWIKTCFYNQDSPSSFYQIGGEQTYVDLYSFTAKSLNSAVLLEWKTATEIDNEGFNLLRCEERDGEYVKINPSFIPSRGDAGFGAEYSYTDYDVENVVTYYYLLEDIDIFGTSTLHGPVSATPNDIMLIWPVEWEVFPSGYSLFSWTISGDFVFKVDVSRSPSFLDSETYSFPDEGWLSSNCLWLRPEEWEMILREAQKSGGQLFWRIRAKGEDSRMIYSSYKKFILKR